MSFRTLICPIPDFPKPGILFQDITPLLVSAAGFREALAELLRPFRQENVSHVVGIESRGFIFGAVAAARELFLQIRHKC